MKVNLLMINSTGREYSNIITVMLTMENGKIINLLVVK